MKSTVVDESLSSFKPMYCSREYQASTRYQEIAFNNITEKLQADYLDRFVGVQAVIHQVSPFDESCAVSTTYMSKIDMPIEDAFRAQEQVSHTD